MENFEKETIAAIATALSDSGIGIVRISGENAIYIVDSIFRSTSGKKILTKVQSHTIHYGYIVDKDENIIDEVMTSVMKAPKSYTMEDTVEINCHGGVLVMQKVLETVLQAGARRVSPYDLFRQAFHPPVTLRPHCSLSAGTADRNRSYGDTRLADAECIAYADQPGGCLWNGFFLPFRERNGFGFFGGMCLF